MSRTLLDNFVQRLTTLIRGPARLREDIADEIADHLASRIEEETVHGGANPDAARIQAEAIRAFGDPQQIARELRSIHMGDWIMFQKIMVAALVVIVIGMAATAYFSWSAAREQARQLEGMNKQLTSLVELQETAPQRALDAAVQREAAAKAAEEKKQQEVMRKAAVPQTKVYFYLGDKSKPAANYAVKMRTFVGAGPTGAAEKADEKGLISLPAGKHWMSGNVVPPEGVVYAGEPTWSRVVEITKDMPDVALEVNVSPRTVHQIELDLSAVTWNREVPHQVEVQLLGSEGQVYNLPGQGFVEREWKSPKYALTWPTPGKTAEITGLYPGEATASVMLYARPAEITWTPEATAEQRQEYANRPVLIVNHKLKVPEGGGIIPLKLRPDSEKKLAGVVFEGSREKPVAGLPIVQSIAPSRSSRVRGTIAPGVAMRSVVTEYLRTNAQGEFVMLGDRSRNALDGARIIAVPWHTSDGREVSFVWPLGLTQAYPLTNDGTFYEIDMSKVGTLRLVFEGVQDLVNSGYQLAGPVEIQEMTHSNAVVSSYFPETRFDPTRTGSVDLLMFESYSPSHEQPAESQPVAASGRGPARPPRRGAGTAPPSGVPAGINPPRDSDAYNRVRLQFVASRPKEGSPDLVTETTYAGEFSFAVAGGGITKLVVPLDKLSEWKASEPKWRRVAGAATQTAPGQ